MSEWRLACSSLQCSELFELFHTMLKGSGAGITIDKRMLAPDSQRLLPDEAYLLVSRRSYWHWK